MYLQSVNNVDIYRYVSYFQRRPANILLLGTGEAGKSTFLKQMKILHGGGFSEEETKNFKVDLMNNVVDNITKLIEMMQTLNIEFKVF